jgi:hypothetical protein
LEWTPAPTPINENRRAQAVEKTGIIGTDQIYLFDIYLEIAKILQVMRQVVLVYMILKTNV